MTADLRTRTRITEELSIPLGSSPPKLPAGVPAGLLQLRVTAGIEDSLALVRTAVLLARHYGATLLVVLPDAGLGRGGCAVSGVEMHLGAAPCSALLSGFLDSVEQKLSNIFCKSPQDFFVELGFLADTSAFLIRICSAGSQTDLSSPSQGAAIKDDSPSLKRQSK